MGQLSSANIICIVLDPFLFNILPGSLLPTAVYLTILAILAWLVSGYIWQGLQLLSQSSETVNPETPKRRLKTD